MSNIFSFPQQQYGVNLQAKKTVGTCSLHVQLHFSLCSLAGVLAVLGFSCSGVSWVLLLLVLLSPCPAWQKSLYIYLSLCPLPLPHPSLPPPSAPPSPYVYIICWSSLRNRNAHGSLCFGSTMWEYTGASSNSSADHFSMIISVCRNYHQGAKIQVRVPVTGRPFFNDKVGMPYLRRGCRIYVEGVVTRSTMSDAGVGGSGYVLRQWLSNYLRVQRAVITILKIIPWAHVTKQMQNC